MKIILLAVAMLMMGANESHAQQVITICTQATGSNGAVSCVPVSTTNPLPTKSN